MTTPAMIKQDSNRVRGLDTLRFFMALWVVLRHFGFPPLNVDETSVSGKLISGITNNLFSGPAAVIVFFIISGFCIHYPFRNGKSLVLLPYFSRRHIRIWLPIIAAVLLARPLNIKLTLFQDSILWSLLAEEIYYLIYPILLISIRKFSWNQILLVSYFAAFLVIMSYPTARNYPSYGPYLNWILGLPCWLLGCILAEKSDQLRATAAQMQVPIWRWRFAAWFLSSLCSALKFHTPIGMPWTLTLFAVFAYYWLQKEILYNQTHAPSTWLENIGKGSYSIYLAHLLGSATYKPLTLPLLAPGINWFLRLLFTLLVCAVFYYLIERPSHLLSRKVAAKLAR